tara:strand:+ start:419 stop:706 length:288 start_codon:yes stop_codon:yes gene_type:complete
MNARTWREWEDQDDRRGEEYLAAPPFEAGLLGDLCGASISELQRADYFYKGIGRSRGGIPQRQPTKAEAARFATYWQKHMEELRQEIHDHDHREI